MLTALLSYRMQFYMVSHHPAETLVSAHLIGKGMDVKDPYLRQKKLELVDSTLSRKATYRDSFLPSQPLCASNWNPFFDTSIKYFIITFTAMSTLLSGLDREDDPRFPLKWRGRKGSAW